MYVGIVEKILPGHKWYIQWLGWNRVYDTKNESPVVKKWLKMRKLIRILWESAVDSIKKMERGWRRSSTRPDQQKSEKGEGGVG